MTQDRVPKEHVERATQTKAIQEVFSDFCFFSSIHGVRYLTERKRHWSERVWWAVAVAASFWLCTSSIRVFWLKWHTNPTKMSFAEKSVPISDIPFAMVTICPETKAYSHKLNITEAYHTLCSSNNLTEIDSTRMESLAHICQFNFYNNFTFDNEAVNESIYDIMEDLAPTLNDTIFNCRWIKKLKSCNQMFSPVFTEEGLCFAFNALNSHEIYTERMAPELMTVKNNLNISHWNMETGYEMTTQTVDTYPIRVFNSNPFHGLNIYLQLFEHDLDFVCRGPIQGYRISLNLPGEEIRISRRALQVPLLDMSALAVKPTKITTSEGLRSYDPIQRGCFFQSERQLSFYRSYTQTNCEIECLTNFTLNDCGCVKFSMPRERGTAICGGSKLECYQNAEEKLFGEDVLDGLTNDFAKSFRAKCNCLPACNSISYDADIDHSKFDWISTLKSYKAYSTNSTGSQPSSVAIFFRESQVNALVRSELYTYTDFMAISGGLLGLFLGGSVLSLIEFIYFSTLRLFWTLKHRNARSAAVGPTKNHVLNAPEDEEEC